MPSKCALNVSLTPELAEFIAAKVQSGHYGSASEVVRSALRFLVQQDQRPDTLKPDVIEAALQESEARFRLLSEVTREGVAVHDRQVVIDCNPAFAGIFGYDGVEEVIGRSVFDFISPESLLLIAQRGFHTSDEPYEVVGRRKNGSTFPAEFAGRNAVWQGKPIRVGLARDLTERMRREAKLRESEARFRNLADNAPVMVWVTEPDGTCSYLSRSWYSFTGQTPETGLGFGWLDAIHPGDREEAERRFTEANAKREAFRVDYRLLQADGTYRWAIDAAAPRFSDDGVFLGYVGSVLDITERKQIEEALRESEARLQAVLRHLPVGVVIAEAPSGKLVLSNEQVDRIWQHGFQPSSSIAEYRVYSGFERGTGRTLEPHEWPLARSITTGDEVIKEEIDFERGNGLRGTMEVSSTPIHDEKGRIIAGVAVFSDVTERAQAEDQRRLLLDELNHRVKNTLATVQSLASQTFKGEHTDQEVRRAFEGRLFALAKAHNVLTREAWQRAELRDIVAEAVEPFQPKDESRFDIGGPRLWVPPAMALPLSMALHELATNAAKYGSLSRPEGRVAITWTVTEKQVRHLLLRWVEQGGPPVSPPTRRGFGTRLIERSLAAELAGEINLTYEPSGVVCVLKAPLGSQDSRSGQEQGNSEGEGMPLRSMPDPVPRDPGKTSHPDLTSVQGGARQ